MSRLVEYAALVAALLVLAAVLRILGPSAHAVLDAVHAGPRAVLAGAR